MLYIKNNKKFLYFGIYSQWHFSNSLLTRIETAIKLGESNSAALRINDNVLNQLENKSKRDNISPSDMDNVINLISKEQLIEQVSLISFDEKMKKKETIAKEK